MPERNILRVHYTKADGFYALLHQDTVRALALRGMQDLDEYLCGTVHRIVSASQVIQADGALVQFKTAIRRTKALETAARLPSSFVGEFGVREGDYVDVTFTELSSGEHVDSTPIFPRALRHGRFDLSLSDISPERSLAEPLITQEFQDDQLRTLTEEINQAFGLGLSRSPLVLYRQLLESLLVHVLRAKFGVKRKELFFDATKAQFLSLGALIDNLRMTRKEFSLYMDSLDDALFQRLHRYKVRGNAAAHHLYEDIDRAFYDRERDQMNSACSLLATLLREVRRTQ